MAFAAPSAPLRSIHAPPPSSEQKSKSVYRPFGAAHHGADKPPPPGSGQVNSVGLSEAPGQQEKKSKFGKYGNTVCIYHCMNEKLLAKSIETDGALGCWRCWLRRRFVRFPHSFNSADCCQQALRLEADLFGLFSSVLCTVLLFFYWNYGIMIMV